MKTGIIIPCYNEENRLNTTEFINFIGQENDYHLCFVNDGSSDNTVAVLKTIQQTNPSKVSILDVKQNAGKAAAVRTGAHYLYKRGDISFIGFIDADLSTDFEDFGDLLNTLQTNSKLNFVFGSRAKNASEGIQKDAIRGFISKIINLLIVLILGLKIEDTQCGAKVFRVELVPMLFSKQFLTRWLFDVEMFIKMKNHFGKTAIMECILEQPLKRWIHMDDSKLGLKDSLETPYRLMSIWFNYSLVQPFNLLNDGVSLTRPEVTIYGTNPTRIAA